MGRQPQDPGRGVTAPLRPEHNLRLLALREGWRQRIPLEDQPDPSARMVDKVNSDGSIKWLALSVDEILDAIAALAEGTVE